MIFRTFAFQLHPLRKSRLKSYNRYDWLYCVIRSRDLDQTRVVLHQNKFSQEPNCSKYMGCSQSLLITWYQEWGMNPRGQYVHWITFSPAPVTPREKSWVGEGVDN